MKIHSVENEGNTTTVKFSFREGELNQFLYDLEAARQPVSGTQLAARLWSYWKKVRALLELTE